MSQENSQLDITDRQMLTVSPQPASVWTEIGEARITHNIFGRAKVRIIRKNDGMRRAMWWTAAIVVAVIAWQGWKAFRPLESQQSADSLPHVIPDVQESTSSPVDNIVPSSMPASADSTAGHNEIVKPPVIEKKEPQTEQGMKAIAPMHRPVAPRPSIVNKPEAMPLAASGTTAAQTMKPLPPKRLAPKSLPPTQVTAPAVAAASAMKPAASSPEAIVPLSSPVMEEKPQTQTPAQQPGQ